MIRKFARPMVASVYIADGADTLLNTETHVEGTEAVMRQVRSVVSRSTYKKLPQDPAQVARAIGGTKIVAGTTLALGKFPRLSAATLALVSLPTIMARHAFWETQDVEEKTARRQGFLTSVALLGGLFITSADTAGKPGLSWRAKKAAAKAQKSLSQADTDWLSETQQKVSQFVDDNRDDWKEAVSSFAETSADWLATAQENSKIARKSLVKAAIKAQDQAAAAYADAQVATGRAAKRAGKRADQLQEKAAKALEKAQKKFDSAL